MAALDMYAMTRRLVFRGCVGPEMWALRGIGAGSAFATRQLFLVMARALGRLAAQRRLVSWSVQVDDVVAIVLGENGAAVCEPTVAVREDIQRELEGGCRLPLVAPSKRTVVATDPAMAEAIAARLGQGAEVGTWCKRLGVDYAMWEAQRGRQPRKIRRCFEHRTHNPHRKFK